jgi:hypothetical protein
MVLYGSLSFNRGHALHYDCYVRVDMYGIMHDKQSIN